MPAVFKDGKWVYEDPLQPLGEANKDFTFDPRADFGEQVKKAREAQGVQTMEPPDVGTPIEAKPFIAQGPGQAFTEVGRQVLNAGGALVTDYMDLISYVGDTAVGVGNVIQGKGFNEGGHFLNDADNPWTQARINAFEPETQLGMGARPIIRTGVALLTLPKSLLKAGLTPFKALGKATKLTPYADDALKQAKNAVGGLNFVDDGVKAQQATTKALLELAPEAADAKKLVGNVAKTSWLYATYDDVAKGIRAGKELTPIASWFDSVQQSTKALTNFNKLSGGQKIRTIGEALAWDAFVAFNASGEGDSLSDETFSDFLESSDWPWLAAIGSPLGTDVTDSSLTLKFKQMTEGTIMGGVLNQVFDTWRVFRFAQNYKKASNEVQVQLLNRFANQAQDIGDGIGSGWESFAKADGAITAAPMDPTVDPWTKGGALARLQQQKLELPVPDAASPVQNRLAQMEGLASPLDESKQLDQALYAGIPQDELVQPGQPSAAAEQFAQQDAQRLTRLRPRDNSYLTPDSIRQAALEDLFNGVDPEDIKRGIDELLPTERVDQVRMLQENPPNPNALGVEDGITSYIRNSLYMKGLMEGWAEVGPDMNVVLRKGVARDLDVGDFNTRQAQALDEATDLEVFQARDIDVEQSFKAAQDVQPPDLDLDATARLAEAELDPAMANATDNYVDTTQQKAEYELREELDLSTARQIADGTASDQEIVRAVTGQDVDNLAQPVVEKAADGKGWEVYTPDGDLVGRTRLKRDAQKLADQQAKANRDALVNRARNEAADMAGQEVSVEITPVPSPDLKGKVTLTNKQIQELTRYPELTQFWDQMKVKPTRKTFEFDMQSMADVSDGIKALLQTGELDPNRAKVLRNLSDRFDTAVKLLAPEARAQAFADGLLDDTTQLASKGEICDFL